MKPQASSSLLLKEGLGYLSYPYNCGPLVLILSWLPSSDFAHPTPCHVPLNQECRELALCIRPLDLLQGDMVMGTGGGSLLAANYSYLDWVNIL